MKMNLQRKKLNTNISDRIGHLSDPTIDLTGRRNSQKNLQQDAERLGPF